MARDRIQRALSVLLLGVTALGFALRAEAGTKLYSGSLIIEAFGNDTTTGALATPTPAGPPFSTFTAVGIPLAGHCNTAPHHPKETLRFPTDGPPFSLTFTIPAYGGAVPTLDTNGDMIPDLAPGCGPATRRAGAPLTGSGMLATTGAASTSRTAGNPRGFTLPQSALNRVTSGASMNPTGPYLWEVHFADLHNDAGVFAKNGGDGSFAIVRSGVEGTRKVVQSAGANRFGGVMRLLGSYGSNEGYLYNGATTSVFYFNWLFHYLGNGSQMTTAGVLTAGHIATAQNYGFTRSSGYPATSTVIAEVFKWTTGTATVTALQGTFPTVFQRNGYDDRTPMGSGVIQMVSPMLTHWIGAGENSFGAIGILKLTFGPEPSEWAMLASGLGMLAILVYRKRRA